MDKTCATCIENDDGLCDRKGTLVQDDDTCDQHKESWKDAMLKIGFLAWQNMVLKQKKTFAQK